MLPRRRFAVALLVALLPISVVLANAEGEEKLVIHNRDPLGSSSSADEMVCSKTEGEQNCKIVVDDSSEDYIRQRVELDDEYDDNEIDGEDDYDYDDEDEDEDDDDEDDYEDDEDDYDDDDDDDDEDEDELVQRIEDDEECVDKETDCQFWADLDPSECLMNPTYMLSDCKKACRACKKHMRYSDILPTVDGRDLGEPQVLDDDDDDDEEEVASREEIEERIEASRKYMIRTLESRALDPELLRACKNDDEMCTIWSLKEECEKNPGFMSLNCGPSCFSCDMLQIEKRCPMDRESIGPDVWSPGDLDKMFRKLSSEPYKTKYDVKVLSSPDGERRGPWALTMENFVSDEEADRLIELGASEGYVRSTDVGEMLPDGTSESTVSKGRTSTNAWCSSDECLDDEVVVSVTNRISNITGIPTVNSEDLQLLRYKPGQKYTRHHDYIEYEVDRQGGVRMVTVYLYLNDVQAGGGTNFPDLGITVMPKRGRVLIWPSVLDSDPNKKDIRTDHQALPVEAGMKYGANAWLHMRNFKGPSENHC